MTLHRGSKASESQNTGCDGSGRVHGATCICNWLNKKKRNTRQKEQDFNIRPNIKQLSSMDQQNENLSTVDMSFARSVEEFIAVDDEIKRIAQEAKELRKNKTVLEGAISSHMLDNELDEGRFEESTVKVVKKRKCSNAFTKSNVLQCALTLFGSERADSLVKMVEDMQETTESHGIKRLRT